MNNLILTLIITIPLTLWGQGWEQVFVEEYFDYSGISVHQTNDSGYVVMGGKDSVELINDIETYTRKGVLIKTDENGNEQWTKTYDCFSNGYNYTGKMDYTYDEGFVFICNNDLFKISPFGDVLWNKTYQYRSNSIKQTIDGGYILVGETESFYNSDVFLIKINESGDTLWTKTYGGNNNDTGKSIKQTTDGGYILVGETESFGILGFNSNVFLIKTNESGDTLWTKTWGGIYDDYGSVVQLTNDGGYVVIGTTLSFGNGNRDVYVIKTDESGDTLWTKTYGGNSHEEGLSILQTTDGGYLISSSIYGSLKLIKTNEFGIEQWSKQFLNHMSSSGDFSIQKTNDNGFIITGGYQLWDDETSDLFIIKTDGYGNILPYESTLNECDSVQSLINETYFSESGTYTYTLTNVFGGDSVVVQEIEIFNSPENIVIEGSTDVFSSTLESYQITINPNNSIEWNVEGETISEVNGNTIEVLWGDEGIGYVEVTETDNNGCSTTSTLEVTISNEPTNIYEYNTTRKLIKTINLLGQEIKPQTGQPIIEIFDDGSVKKKLIIE